MDAPQLLIEVSEALELLIELIEADALDDEDLCNEPVLGERDR